MKTDYKKVIETEAEGLKISAVENKETVSKETGEKIFYKKIKFTYEHPQDNGSKIRARPNFSTPELHVPRGINFNKKGKLTAFTVFDINDDDQKLFISNKAKTQSRGWVPEQNVKIITKSGKTFAKASRDGELQSEPKEGSDVILTFKKNDLMNVEDEKEINDETWYLVAAGGQEGFFSTINNKIAELFKNDKRTGYEGKSLDEIKSVMKDPVYWPVDKETGEPIENKNPSIFFNCTYFAANPKEKRKENYVKLKVPGEKDHLDSEIMKKSALKLKTGVLQLIDVYVGGNQIIPHLYLTEGLVIDISEIKVFDELDEEAKQYDEDDDLVAKIRKQMAEAKKFEAPKFKDDSKEEASQAINNSVKEEDDGEDFSSLINNEPKKGSALEDLEATMDENVVIPGLPDDD